MRCRRKLTPVEQETRRVKNHEDMRNIRQCQRQELVQMKATVAELEKHYAELCRRAEAAGKDTELVTLQTSVRDDQGHDDLMALAKQLGAEKLLLQTMLKQKTAWRVLDFEISSLAAAQRSLRAVNVQLDTMDDVQAEEELGFYPLTEWGLTQRNGVRLHEKVYHSQRTHKTWTNDIQLARFKIVKAETSRLQVLQQMNLNAYVFVRDVDSPSEISIFRSVFEHFLVEAFTEFPDSNGDSLTGTGYVLGTQSVATECRPSLSIERDDADRKIAWVDLALTTEAYDVENPTTGEKYQQVVWAGRTDYRPEQDAQRNAADTLQGLLRWELKIVAPALNLKSLCID
ncbi:hypothetical protein PHYPSEUDO_005771 [Phytophthora pseudosyringae]|uniref:Uncharacterized protein n=1 Tax=Phytophthora pseudosyringae TaxID=221518 RepID=A0A8T1VKB9_9STRA|nr:hypothetical protein PHYPSEUDO_005771 [Phytophthora pseudosyringae]